MSGAQRQTHSAVMDDAADGASVIEQLGERLRTRLRAAGVLIPDERFDQLAEDVMADAIQVALAWLESDSADVVTPSFPGAR
jgi:hypothetical protein